MTWTHSIAVRRISFGKTDVVVMRHDFGLSQERLAFLCGVNPRTVARWEAASGEPLQNDALQALLVLRARRVRRAAVGKVILKLYVDTRGVFLRDLFMLAYPKRRKA